MLAIREKASKCLHYSGQSMARVAREFNRERTTAFPLSYEDNGATRTESVLFDRKEQEEDLVFPVDKGDEREFSVAKACREGETSMQVSACTQP
jgi:hypothetical protein